MISRVYKEPFWWILGGFLVLAGARIFANLPWCDEGWFFDPVYNWITKGHTGTTIEEATGFPWEGIERHMYWQAPMHLLVHRAWLSIFGLTLASFRALELAAGVCALLFWRYLLRYIGMPRAILTVSLLLIAGDYAFVRTASDGRPDMVASAFGLAGVVAYLYFRDRNFSLAVFLSQTLCVCGGLTHPMGGLLYLGYIALFFVLQKDWKRLRLMHLALAALPYVVGAAAWGAYIMQEPETFRKIFFGSSAHGRLRTILNPLNSLVSEVVERYMVPNGWAGTTLPMRAKRLIPLVYFFGVLAALAIPSVRRIRHMRVLLSLWAIGAVGLFLLDAQRNGTYLAHVFPLYAAVLATCYCGLSENAGVMRRIFLGVIFWGFFALQVGGSLYIIYTNPYRNDFMAAVNFVKQNATLGRSHIVGTPELGFGLGFDNVLDDLTLGYHNGRKPDVILVNPRYQSWFTTFEGWKPEIARFVTNRLHTEYRKAFESATFEVYLPQ